MRYEEKSACRECGECSSKTVCAPVRKKLRTYSGIRFTSDGFDCALPVSIDSHSICSYGCLYCFSDNLIQHREGRQRAIGQTSLDFLEAIFSGREGKQYDQYRQALKYDRKKNGYPCAVQLGAINDPCDNIERNQGWLLKFIDLAIKYNQPVRISTKGKLFLLDDYVKAIAKKPELFWVAFSIITPDDDLIARVDRRAPDATARLKTMKKLSSLGVKTSLRFRPILPGISDSTPKYKKAYKVLVEKAAEAGAEAVSYEVGFVSGMMDKNIRKKWGKLEKIAGISYGELYKTFGKVQACMRPPHTWTEDIMHKIAEESRKNGLVVGVSDPVWKQLGDSGCCCGILPDDKVFGNWEREGATNALLTAKKNKTEITIEDIIPPWAYNVKLSQLVNVGVGEKVAYKTRHFTWADQLTEIWNELKKERSPLNYFQGAIVPVRRDKNGNVVYKYQGLKRQHKKQQYWKT